MTYSDLPKIQLRIQFFFKLSKQITKKISKQRTKMKKKEKSDHQNQSITHTVPELTLEINFADRKPNGKIPGTNAVWQVKKKNEREREEYRKPSGKTAGSPKKSQR